MLHAKSTLIPSLALLCAPLAAAQTAIQPSPVTSPIRDAGVYHVATGTWSRPGAGVANFGPQIVYNNDASSGGYLAPNLAEIIVDEGHVPSFSAVGTVGTNQGYEINGFQIGYCTYTTAGPSYEFQFYANYTPCSDPLTGSTTGPTGPLFDTTAMGLPGAATNGAQRCWVVTIDLENTPDTFCLEADGADGFYDNSDPGLDSFGWSFQLLDNSQGAEGLLIRADPNNSPEGDGTTFQNPGQLGTGLLTQDFFRVTKLNIPTDSGCFFFGGYNNGNGFGSFHMRLLAATPECAGPPAGPVGQSYCFSLTNSTGNIAEISGFGSAAVSAQNLTLTTVDVPGTASGIHYFGSNQTAVPFGDGIRCVSGQVLRYPFAMAAGGVLTQDVFLGPGPAQLLPGTTWNFQAWFRDPTGPLGTGFNLSDALEVTFL